MLLISRNTARQSPISSIVFSYTHVQINGLFAVAKVRVADRLLLLGENRDYRIDF